MSLKIRPETLPDYPAITEVNDLAFGQHTEGKLVENLRKNPKFIPELSLVAEVDGKTVSHILFFPIIIKCGDGNKKEINSLASVAVLPEFQKQGVGGELIREGLKAFRSEDTILL